MSKKGENMPSKKNVLKNFRVSEEFNADLKEFSSQLDVTESEILRKAFYMYRDSIEHPLKRSVVARHRSQPIKR